MLTFFGELAKQQPPLELIVCLPSCQLCLTPVISRIACLPARLANPPSHPVCPAHVLAISPAKPFPRFLHLSPSDYLSDNVHIRRFTRVDLMARFIWLPIALTPESESKTEERSCQRRLSKLRVKLSAHPWTFVSESPQTFISDGGGLRLCSSPESKFLPRVSHASLLVFIQNFCAGFIIFSHKDASNGMHWASGCLCFLIQVNVTLNSALTRDSGSVSSFPLSSL